MNKKMKNRLVIYQGGGADGEFWSWNVFFYDGEGNWHDIHSNGYAGMGKEPTAQELRDLRGKKETTVYDVTNSEHCKELVKEWNIQLVLGIWDFLCDNQHENNIIIRCPSCNQQLEDRDDFRMTGYEGDGGVGITVTDWKCQSCYALSHCQHCDAELGTKADRECQQEFDHCMGCLESHLLERKSRLYIHMKNGGNVADPKNGYIAMEKEAIDRIHAFMDRVEDEEENGVEDFETELARFMDDTRKGGAAKKVVDFWDSYIALELGDSRSAGPLLRGFVKHLLSDGTLITI